MESRTLDYGAEGLRAEDESANAAVGGRARETCVYGRSRFGEMAQLVLV